MSPEDIKRAKAEAIELSCSVLTQSRFNDATGLRAFAYSEGERMQAAAVLAALLSLEAPEKLAAATNAKPAEPDAASASASDEKAS